MTDSTTKPTPGYDPAPTVTTGAKITLPEGMTYAKLAQWCQRMQEQEEQEIAIMHVIAAPCLDAAVAFMQALTNLYGWVSPTSTPGFFGRRPPTMIAVPTGPNGETIPVMWGRIHIPNMTGYLETGTHITDSGDWQFQISGQTIQRHKAEVERIAAETRRILAQSSIYRGKALRLNFERDPQTVSNPIDAAPRFLTGLANITRDDLILPHVASDLVDVALLAPIRHTDACRRARIPIKRGILLSGPYGTGKTLTSLVTAVEAMRHGWTFLYLERVADLVQAIRFAQSLGGPCVIFSEDIDRAASGAGDRNDTINAVMNAIDGIDSKNSEIMTVVTTNHVDQIPQALLRPGRFDAVIPVEPPDAFAAAALMRLFGGRMIDVNEDLSAVAQQLAGSIPAVIREVVERSKLAAIARFPDVDALSLRLTSADLTIAAQGMIAHLALLAVQVPDTRSEREKAAQIIADSLKTVQPPRAENTIPAYAGSLD